MKLFFIAGERSGDLHGGNLIEAIKTKKPSVEMQAWGGERMQQAGATLLKHYKDTAIMGLTEVIKKLPTIFKNLSDCKADILQFAPDAVVLIDYAGFNMKIAKFCKERGIKVFYYIAPKVWAWNTGRVYKIQKYVDELLVIFPFEKDFFEKYNISTSYVGNPLMDEIEAFKPNESFAKENNIDQKPVVALLAGSRVQEVKSILPTMLRVMDYFPDYEFVISGVDNISKQIYEDSIRGKKVKIIYGNTYNLLYMAKAALVTSGTATLETALLHCPQIVCYKTGKIQYSLGKHLIKVPYISLVNLILNKLAVPELIQNKLNTEQLQIHLKTLLHPSEALFNQLLDYKNLSKMVGKAGASDRAAEVILEKA